MAEQQEAALLSGKAAASDIAAGFALGQAVAAVFVARAGSDGLKAATGTPAQWQALADAATARGEIPWKSQEIPPRPPMLPFFGQVQAWMMAPADIINERPGPPPSTSSAQMAQETAQVKAIVAEPDARPACDRHQMGRRGELSDTSRALELHCGIIYCERPVQRGAVGAGFRASRYGPT